MLVVAAAINNHGDGCGGGYDSCGRNGHDNGGGGGHSDNRFEIF